MTKEGKSFVLLIIANVIFNRFHIKVRVFEKRVELEHKKNVWEILNHTFWQKPTLVLELSLYGTIVKVSKEKNVYIYKWYYLYVYQVNMWEKYPFLT